MAKDKLISFISSEFYNGDSIEGSTDLLAEGLIDSIGFMKIIQFIEENLGHKVEPQDMVIDHFMTIDAMVDYINS